MVLTNPFKPTAGMTPPVLMGRETVIQDFTDGLLEGPGSPGRLMRITGPRGSGKTVLLTELGEIAQARGWRVVDVVSDEDVCDSVVRQLRRTVRPKNVKVNASLPFVSAEVDFGGLPDDATFREVLEHAVRNLTERGAGLLITLDEAQNVDRSAMSTIASCVQLLIRERQNIAFVFAGITTGVLDLLNNKSLTFLRRARSEELASIPVDEVAEALRETIERSGMSIGNAALVRAAEATEGYAYLTQLVGYDIWRVARRHVEASTEVTLKDVEQGVQMANSEYNSAVLDTALADLSRPAIEYLLAMCEDEKASSTGAIAERLGRRTGDANTYRRILISRQIIESTATGYVAFSMPRMREYLQEHREEILARYGG